MVAVMTAKAEVFTSDDGTRHYWHVVGGNGEIVAPSEAYTRRHDAMRGLDDARRAFRETDPAVQELVATIERQAREIVRLNQALMGEHDTGD